MLAADTRLVTDENRHDRHFVGGRGLRDARQPPVDTAAPGGDRGTTE